jgi:type I restriction enzyme, S subunit
MSSSEWKELTLGDICAFTTDRIEVSELTLDNYISTENMIPNKGGITRASSLPNSKTVTKCVVGNTLISNIRPYFKKIWYCEYTGGSSNDVLNIIPKSNSIDEKYLYYFLSQDKFFDFMVSTSKGTKMPRGDKKAIMNYQISLPSIKEQREIASFFSSLDEKIVVNNEMNKVLKELAETIYKHWFIDFEFPNENGQPYKSSGGNFIESELGLIPEGWVVKSIEQICDITSSKRVFLKDYVPQGIPFYRSKEIIEKSKGTNISTELYIGEDLYEKLKLKYGVPIKGDILLTSVGTLGIPYLVQDQEEFYFKDGNLTWFKNFINENMNLYLYYWLLSKEGRNNIDSITIGSTQKALTISALKNIKICIPCSNILNSFTELFTSVHNHIQENDKQNINLIEIRNLLLPKLLSGEIHLNEVGKEVIECLQKSN